MIKKLVLIIILICNYSLLNAQKKEFDIIEIEVKKGPYCSILFYEEGLLCKFHDSIVFYKKNNLNISKVDILQEYLRLEPFFHNDSIIDKIGVSYYFSFCSHLEINVIYNKALVNINWVDGECDYLEKLIILLNDIIPEEEREKYGIMYEPY